MKYLIIFAIALICVTSVPVGQQEHLHPSGPRRNLIFRGEDQNQVVQGPQGPRPQQGQGEQREPEEEEGQCANECDNQGRGCDECRPCVGLVEGDCPEWCLEQCGPCAQCHGFQLPERRQRRRRQQGEQRREGEQQLVSERPQRQEGEEGQRPERPEGPRPEGQDVEDELRERVGGLVEEHDLDEEDLERLAEDHVPRRRRRPRRQEQDLVDEELETVLVSRRGNGNRGGNHLKQQGGEQRPERPEGPRPEGQDVEDELRERLGGLVDEHDLDNLDEDHLEGLERLAEDHVPRRRRRRPRRQEQDLVDEELETVLVSRRGNGNRGGNHLKQQGGEQRPERPQRQQGEEGQRPERPQRGEGEENNRQARQGLRRNN